MAPRPSYLLTDIPPDLREALTRAATGSGCSVSGLVRAALMERFELDPPARSDMAERMVIRAEPELFTAIKREAHENETTMKQVIIDALRDRYGDLGS